MMINAILIAQNQMGGYSEATHDDIKNFQNAQVYIGDSTDWRENELCPGGPYMTTEADSDSWYFDERARQIVWSFGAEIWCNKSG